MSKFLDETGLNYLINKYKSRFKTDRLDITKDGESYFHMNITSNGSVQMVGDLGEFKLKTNNGNIAFEPQDNARITASNGNIIMKSKEGVQVDTDSNINVYTKNLFLLNTVRNSELNSNGSSFHLGSDSEIHTGGNLSIKAYPRTILYENNPYVDEDDVLTYLSGNIEMECTDLKTQSLSFTAKVDNGFGIVSTYEDDPHHLMSSYLNATKIQSFFHKDDLYVLSGELVVGMLSSIRGHNILMKFCDENGEFEEEFSMRNIICKNIDNILDKELPLNERYVNGSMRELLTSRCFVGGCPVKIIPGNFCAWIVCEHIDDSEEFSNEYTIVTEYYKITSGYDNEGKEIIKYADVYMKKTSNISAEDSSEDNGDVEEQA